MDFITRFHDLKKQRGLTTTALAFPRYSVSYISRIEAGQRRPSPEALAHLAERLGVSSDYLATGIPDGLESSIRFRLEDARRQLYAETAAAVEESLRDLLAEVEGYKLDSLRAMILAALGVSLRLQAHFREAIEAFEQALEIGLPTIDEGAVVGELGRAYRSVGDLSYAIEVVDSHLAKNQQQPLDPTVVTDLHSVLTSLYFERGDIVRAEVAARRAMAAAESLAPSDTRAVAYWHASRVFAENKEWDKALELAARARVLLLAYLLSERGRLALMEGKPEDALALTERALVEAASDNLERGRCLFLQGRALASLGRRAEAKDALQEASAVFDKHGARQQQAGCWREIAEIDLAAGDVASAVEAFRSGLQALDPRRSRA